MAEVRKHICEGCGEIHKEAWMMGYSSGRKTHWFCWSCWKAGQGEAAVVEVNRKRKQRLEAMKRK